jgi:hypothetical protein
MSRFGKVVWKRKLIARRISVLFKGNRVFILKESKFKKIST